MLAMAVAARPPSPPWGRAPAPDFTLRQIDGRNLRLQEQRGQVVLVNFWATWCGPCRAGDAAPEPPARQVPRRGFTLLGVNIDDDPRRRATGGALGLKFPVLLDTDKKVVGAYDLGSMPATVLIDRDGRVRFLHRGYREGIEHRTSSRSASW
jgi:peroxiredoxin